MARLNAPSFASLRHVGFVNRTATFDGRHSITHDPSERATTSTGEPRNETAHRAFPAAMPIRHAFALSALILFAGCAAQRPVLYPTEPLSQADVASDHDVRECEQLADAHVQSTLPADTVRATAIGGGIGAASGVVGGAIFGSPGTGAAVGAASGATASLLGSLLRSNTPNATYQGYVSTCLADRGYRVVGWR